MLIMHLRVNESMTLPDGVEVMVTSMGVRGMRIQGGWVKLGIVAPQHVRVVPGKRLAGSSPKPRRKP